MQFSFIHYSFIMCFGLRGALQPRQRLQQQQQRQQLEWHMRDSQSHSHVDCLLGCIFAFDLSSNSLAEIEKLKNNCQFQVNCLFTLLIVNREIAGAIIQSLSLSPSFSLYGTVCKLWKYDGDFICIDPGN